MAIGTNEVWTVEFWREEFDKIKKQMPQRWRKTLAGHNSFFNTKEGADMMDLVADGRASLEKTAKVVNACKDYIEGNGLDTPIANLMQRQKIATGNGYQPKYPATESLKKKMQKTKTA